MTDYKDLEALAKKKGVWCHREVRSDMFTSSPDGVDVKITLDRVYLGFRLTIYTPTETNFRATHAFLSELEDVAEER